MPPSPRIDVPGFPQHLIARGNNRGPCFFNDRDRRVFLKYLGEACVIHECDVHALVLMTNHVHLLATGKRPGSISRTMQSVERRYSRYVNSAYGRTGTLYDGRFKSSIVETGAYFLACMRYIELNPVRAGMVAMPADFAWSSFRQNSSGLPKGLITAHAEYL